MKKRVIVSTIFITLFIGCVSNNSLSSNLSPSSSLAQKKLIFQTNTSTILNGLKNTTTKEERNLYIDEFFLKSDMQCRQYLNTPVVSQHKNDTTNQLYVGIFDTVSLMFGLKGITDTAKEVYSSSEISNMENKKAYKNALSPEIQYGVKITRDRYAKKMNSKKNLSIKEYPISQLQKDMQIYDKQCNEEYGLIEINRALKAMQHNINQPQATAKIDAKTIKDKVAKVTKEVKKKEEVKKEETKN